MKKASEEQFDLARADHVEFVPHGEPLRVELDAAGMTSAVFVLNLVVKFVQPCAVWFLHMASQKSMYAKDWRSRTHGTQAT